jgi:hypothetical protein
MAVDAASFDPTPPPHARLLVDPAGVALDGED